MTKKLLFVSAILLALVVAAMAADVAGKWTLTQPGRNGGPDRVTTFEFKADGAKLTGTVAMPAMGRGGDTPATPPPPAQIANGKVDGDKISFDVTREFGGNSMTTKYEGVVAGAQINFKITSPGFNGGDPQTREAVAKKAN
jgi:opacity protein-like surface antigen